MSRRVWIHSLGATLLWLCLGTYSWAKPPLRLAFSPHLGKKAGVLLFIARDCPISNAYAPEIKRILTAYAPQKIAFELVYPDPGTTSAAAHQHAKDYGYTCPIVLDPTHRLAKKYGATVTPEAVVLSPQGKILYRGRIDDLFVTFGQRRFQVTKHDLRQALEAVLRGKPIATPRTTAIGCFI